MCGGWRLDEQDLNTYRTEGLVKSPFRIPDEQLGRMHDSLEKLLRDDASPENGCMRYIPGSHSSGSIYGHRMSGRKPL